LKALYDTFVPRGSAENVDCSVVGVVLRVPGGARPHRAAVAAHRSARGQRVARARRASGQRVPRRSRVRAGARALSSSRSRSRSSRSAVCGRIAGRRWHQFHERQPACGSERGRRPPELLARLGRRAAADRAVRAHAAPRRHAPAAPGLLHAAAGVRARGKRAHLRAGAAQDGAARQQGRGGGVRAGPAQHRDHHPSGAFLARLHPPLQPPRLRRRRVQRHWLVLARRRGAAGGRLGGDDGGLAAARGGSGVAVGAAAAGVRRRHRPRARAARLDDGLLAVQKPLQKPHAAARRRGRLRGAAAPGVAHDHRLLQLEPGAAGRRGPSLGVLARRAQHGGGAARGGRGAHDLAVLPLAGGGLAPLRAGTY
jgi:hypothetical protein